jgi:dTMP kinase
LHYAARNEHIEKTIRPALVRGFCVISDRFADSTIAYQGAGLGLESDVLECLRRIVVNDLAPDLTIILDLEAEQAIRRAGRRAPTRDRYESMDLQFHQRVRSAFIEIARRDALRYAVVDAASDVRQVQLAVRDVVRTRLGVKLDG